MSTLDASRSSEDEATTTVEVRATGKVRDALPTHSMEFVFAGETL